MVVQVSLALTTRLLALWMHPDGFTFKLLNHLGCFIYKEQLTLSITKDHEGKDLSNIFFTE